ncbi:helix-turn-helix transcriptional regulator [Staphylococcus aureus]|uniref:helix-turn-helix transcriptional regulator n=1 Tax=Staphylococcus aureus TaxID=1280 RepID=UPI003D7F065D
MTWQRKIQRLLDEHNMTVGQFAKRINKSPSTVYNWKNGTTSPTREDMIKTANIFNTTADVLFFDETDALYPTG